MMAHIKNDKGKKEVGGRSGTERKLSPVAGWKEKLCLAS